MGCSSSNSSPPLVDEGAVQKVASRQQSAKTKATDNENVSYPPSEAYVISFNAVENAKDNNDEAAVAATVVTTATWSGTETFHPPERLQKSHVEQSLTNNDTDDIAPTTTTTTTIETITEKLEKAELRRQAIMLQKIEKAQKLMRNFDETIREKENEGESERHDEALRNL